MTDENNARFIWPRFLFWTLLSAALIFSALRVLVGFEPPQPFMIHHFKDANFGRLVLLVLIACTVVFSAYFLTVAALPGAGPHTRPAGRWLIVAIVLVFVMTSLFVAGAISYTETNPLSLTPERFLTLLKEAPTRFDASIQSQDALAAVLLVTFTLALSTAGIVSNLATSLNGCSKEQNAKITSFLLWMHGILAVLVLIYAALLYKTNIRASDKLADGIFIYYFALFYLMISIVTFLVPIVQYGVLTKPMTLLSLGGFTMPSWAPSALKYSGLENQLPVLHILWEKI
jgi:hypothetical protein